MFIVEHKTTKEEKFGVLYQLYIKDIYKVCLHLTMNEEQAQEIAKQTFVNFYEHFENVSSDCVFSYCVSSYWKAASKPAFSTSTSGEIRSAR